MFDASDARVTFYSNETGDSYDVRCCARMSGEDCAEVRALAASTAPRLYVQVAVSRFQELHNTFDYERDLIDVERGGDMLNLLRLLRDVGISAYVDGLSWG